MEKHLNRSIQREKALQVLFQLEINPQLDISQAFQQVYDFDYSDLQEEAFVDINSHYPYAVSLVRGIIEKQAELDEKIKPFLSKTWTLERLNTIDRLILRLATYELTEVSVDSVPVKVAIDEALELAKKYSEDKSKSFINGVLSSMADQLA